MIGKPVLLATYIASTLLTVAALDIGFTQTTDTAVLVQPTPSPTAMPSPTPLRSGETPKATIEAPITTHSATPTPLIPLIADAAVSTPALPVPTLVPIPTWPAPPTYAPLPTFPPWPTWPPFPTPHDDD